jgi:hypothetical protein
MAAEVAVAAKKLELGAVRERGIFGLQGSSGQRPKVGGDFEAGRDGAQKIERPAQAIRVGIRRQGST